MTKRLRYGIGQDAAFSRRELLLGVVAAAGGCATHQHIPPLAELYGDIAPLEPRPPLVIIPGTFGSRLLRRASGEEIWPRRNASLLFSNYRDIELEIDPRTLDPIVGDGEPEGLFLQAFGRDFYGALLQTLEIAGGYRQGSVVPPSNPSDRTYYIHDYDWRLDTLVGVRGLHELIERIGEIHGDSGQRVDILAHSNGGLMARYYARYGTADMLNENPAAPIFNGSNRIRRLLLVGTPNLGTIQAVLSHVRGEEVGFRHIPPEVIATCPSAMQLMPHPNYPWLVNLRGEPVNLDMYDIETWRQLRWSIFSEDSRNRIVRRHGNGRSGDAYAEILEAYLARHFERGRRFHESLAGPARPGEPRPFIFGGDCTPTLSRLALERDGDTYRAHEHAGRIRGAAPDVDLGALMNEPGDSVVTRSSLIGRSRRGETAGVEPLHISHSVFLCAEHQLLTANASFQDNFLYTLLHLEDE